MEFLVPDGMAGNHLPGQGRGGVVGDERQIEREGLAAELQVVGADLGAVFLKLESDFGGFHGGVPIEGQEVERSRKVETFRPSRSGSLHRKTPANNSKTLTIDTAQSSGLREASFRTTAGFPRMAAMQTFVSRR
jgi:hypothetical protein